VLVGLAAACASPSPVSPGEARSITADAYVFAYPMLFHYGALYNQTQDPADPRAIGAFNRFRHDVAGYGPGSGRAVVPGNDSPVSWAWLDLRAQPLVLSVPAVPDDRPYSFQFVDLFARTIGYVGALATGPGGGTYLVAGPGWDGVVPDDVDEVIRSGSGFVMVLGRFGVFDREDVANVVALQEQCRLAPLSAFTGQSDPGSAGDVDWLPWAPEEALSPAFVRYLNLILRFAEPDAPEAAQLDAFAPIGISAGRSYRFDDLHSAHQLALIGGIADGGAAIEVRVAAFVWVVA
jgi:hypothetical protein